MSAGPQAGKYNSVGAEPIGQRTASPNPEFLPITTSLHRPLARHWIGLGAAVALLDFAVVMGAGFSAYSLRSFLARFMDDPQSAPATMLPGGALLEFLVMYALLTVVSNAIQNLYFEEVLNSTYVARVRIAKGFFFSSLLAIGVVFVSGEKDVPRAICITTMVLSLSFLLLLRYAMQHYNLRRIERGIATQHVLIVGGGEIGQAFRQYLERHHYLGKMFCGFVDTSHRNSPYWLGAPEDLPRILNEQFIDEIYFTPEISRDVVLQVALQAREERISVKVVPDLYNGLALGAGMHYIGNVPVLELNRQPIPAVGLFIKRMIDIVVTSTLLVLTAPVMIVAALLIKLDSRGPVFYSAWRVGRKGRRFLCYKFRTMVVDADTKKDELRHLNEREGATFKITNDPRITSFGKFLRKFSIDELPQLFNVLRGEMSIVGPRPHPVDDFHHYQPEDLRRLDVLPGVTGLWQVSARRDPSFEKNVLLDLEYISNWNLLLDIKIILKTVPEVLRGSGR